MLHLESTKCTFLFCLGFCILICCAIYLNAKTSDSTGPVTTHQSKEGCRPLPQRCDSILDTRMGMTWRRKDCLTEAYLTAPNFSCSHMLSELHFITVPLSREEEDYPMAFIVTIHKELETFARLLRAIYAPQNVYCVHVDNKSPASYRVAVERLAGCFPNVFLASAQENVTYAGFSRLKADINCMADLERSTVPWRKVVNLCGQDFPIMSNLELVRYMQSADWRDRNMTPGIKQPPTMRHRTEMQHTEVKGSHVAPKGRGHKKGPPPHNLEIYFGTAYYSLTREFVKFVLNNNLARDLLEWSKDTYSPDEHYWVTLNHVYNAPGNHVNGGWEGSVRAIKWKDQEKTAHDGCKGRYVRDICIYGLEDLPWIIGKDSMFANKFETQSFPEALDCIEEWHRHKVLQQAEVPVESAWQLSVEEEVVTNTNSTMGPP
ncbi:hypothetical protein JZ751_017973 [Albula glossodonta]|uniref:Glucosaminyl (N-acetyl) transferase family member 7 n=1 Tax=Albula glossodonta TaxID=121402 RepID=A0A8T2PPY0_9TELE|nr:hypothetical protein JZ751_017973 [Albula glossodonta]